MQEVDIEVLQFSIYFTYVSVSDPMYAQEISASRSAELCLGVVVRNNNLIPPQHTHTYTYTHTHTHHTPLKTSLTTFFFTPLTVHTRYFSCVAVTHRDWPTFFQCCYSLPTCTIISIVSFTRRNLESIHDISFDNERVTKTGIFKWLSKNA